MVGEIFNLEMLAKKLKKAGVYLKGGVPEEVLIELYRYSGASIWEELHGKFTVALYNHKTNTLTAIRDKWGSKPLYYCLTNTGIELRRELKAFQATALNKDALQHYFAFNYVPEDATVYQNVYHLPAGCMLTYQEKTGIQIRPYVDLMLIHGTQHSLVTENRMRETIAKSINDVLDSVKQVGIRLTGDVMDVALTSLIKEGKAEPHAFYLYCEGANSEEKVYIEKVVEELAIKATYLMITPQTYYQAMKVALTLLQTPIVDVDIPLELLFFRAVNHQVDAILSLDGEKELFTYDLAYQRQQKLEILTNRSDNTKAKLLKASNHLPNHLKKVKCLLQQSCLPLSSHYPGSQRDELETLLNKKRAPWQEITNPIYEEIVDLGWLEQMQTIDLNTKLKVALLRSDVFSNVMNLHIKQPFLNEKVFEMANDLTKDEKLGKGSQKPLLMEAFKHDVPEVVLSSKKNVATVPLAKWLREDLYEEIHQLFNDELAKEWIDMAAVKQRLEQHRLKKGDHSQEIWTVAVFILWLQSLI